MSEKNEPGNFRVTDKIDTFDSIKNTNYEKSIFFIISYPVIGSICL